MRGRSASAGVVEPSREPTNFSWAWRSPMGLPTSTAKCICLEACACSLLKRVITTSILSDVLHVSGS